jgi:putative transcriptional regulator
MVEFHPPEGLLFDYATGALSQPWSVLVATHLTLCPACRAEAGRLDELGGVLMDEARPVPLAGGALADLMARIDGEEPIAIPSAPPPVDDPVLPRPLAAYLGCDLAGVPWRTILPGVQEYAVPNPGPAGRPAMLRIRAGRPVPRHTHAGNEAIVLLAGGFTDGIGHYRRGDVSWADGSHEHKPVADRDADCICFTVTDAPVRFTGRIGRLLNFFSAD